MEMKAGYRRLRKVMETNSRIILLSIVYDFYTPGAVQ